jgi:hypothetical protein
MAKLWINSIGIVACFVATILLPPRVVFGCNGCGAAPSKPRSTSGQSSGPALKGSERGLTKTRMAGKHGGFVSATRHYYCEVVFEPQQTKLFFYNPGQTKCHVRGVVGEMVLKVNGDAREYRYPLELVAQPAWTGDNGYLVANADVSRVHDGDMEVVFRLRELPNPEEREVEFSQVFHLSATRPPIVTEPFSERDYRLAAQQCVCPVTNTAFAAQANPIKVVVGQQPVYVCCESCVSEVEKNPALYVQKARQLFHANAPMARVLVSAVNELDRDAIGAQVWCPVKRARLGQFGPPIKVAINGNVIFVADEQSVAAVQRDPTYFIQEVGRVRHLVARRQQARTVAAANMGAE